MENIFSHSDTSFLLHCTDVDLTKLILKVYVLNFTTRWSSCITLDHVSFLEAVWHAARDFSLFEIVQCLFLRYCFTVGIHSCIYEIVMLFKFILINMLTTIISTYPPQWLPSDQANRNLSQISVLFLCTALSKFFTVMTYTEANLFDNLVYFM